MQEYNRVKNPTPWIGGRYMNVPKSALQLSQELRPEYQGTVDESGNLLSKYQVNSAQAAQQSPWAAMMKQKMDAQRQMESDKLAESGAAQAAAQRSMAAMRGGLSQGASERMGQAQLREQMMGDQRLASQAMMGNLDIGARDYQQNLQNQQFNLQNALAGVSDRNRFEMDKYKETMAAIGAERQAKATEKSGKVICTELFRQGLMSEKVYAADQKFGEIMQLECPEVMLGYWKLARPVVKAMQSSRLVTSVVRLIATPWAKHMAHRMGASEDSLVGKALMAVGLSVCRAVGRRIVSKSLCGAVG